MPEYIWIIAAILTVITGVVLGVLGGGGSMMILPLFVYLLKLEPQQAVVYSLFIIGVASVLGAYTHYRLGHIKVPIVLYFGIPSIAAVLFTRRWLLPSLPKVFFSWGSFELKQETFLLVLFALLMVMAAIYMIINAPKADPPVGEQRITWSLLIMQGLLVGTLTGLVGAGGGFLIIPALVYFTRLPIRFAVGTSLSIIALNTLIGFAGSIGSFAIDWKFMLLFTLFTAIGIVIGSRLSGKLDQIRMKAAFGYLVLVIAAFMLWKELL